MAEALSHAMRNTSYMAFAGSGMYGLSFVGALRALREMDAFDALRSNLKGCCGTSSGTVMALFVLVDAPIERLMNIVRDTEAGIVPDVDLTNLFGGGNYGLDDGKRLREIIATVIEEAGLAATTTFADLFRLTHKDFVCCVTCVNTHQPVHLGHRTHPDLKIADAMYMSMTLPFIFVPQQIGNQIFADGCLTQNLPLAFPQRGTLHFNVYAPKMREIRNWREYAYSVFRCTLAHQDANVEAIRSADPMRVVGIRIPYSYTISLRISNGEVEQLVRSGYARVACMRHPQLAPCLADLLRVLLHDGGAMMAVARRSP